mmetsp:Transcript_20448/g.49166  ORF Transcript_20448/g.49166 Transcript_20448/m.49166 type:complete len:168 (-) Transcript_20448:61-564(-)
MHPCGGRRVGVISTTPFSQRGLSALLVLLVCGHTVWMLMSTFHRNSSFLSTPSKSISAGGEEYHSLVVVEAESAKEGVAGNIKGSGSDDPANYGIIMSQSHGTRADTSLSLSLSAAASLPIPSNASTTNESNNTNESNTTGSSTGSWKIKQRTSILSHTHWKSYSRY